MDNAKFSNETDDLDLLRWAVSGLDHDESDESGENDTLAGSASPKVHFHVSSRHRGRNPGPWPGPKATNVDKLLATQVPTQKFVINVHKWSFDGDFKRTRDAVTLLLSPKASCTSEVSLEWNMYDLDVYPMEYATKAILS